MSAVKLRVASCTDLSKHLSECATRCGRLRSFNCLLCLPFCCEPWNLVREQISSKLKVFSNTPSATQSAGKQVSPADSEAVQHREITTHTHTHMSTHTSTHTNNPVFVMLQAIGCAWWSPETRSSYQIWMADLARQFTGHLSLSLSLFHPSVPASISVHLYKPLSPSPSVRISFIPCLFSSLSSERTATCGRRTNPSTTSQAENQQGATP